MSSQASSDAPEQFFFFDGCDEYLEDGPPLCKWLVKGGGLTKPLQLNQHTYLSFVLLFSEVFVEIFFLVQMADIRHLSLSTGAR